MRCQQRCGPTRRPIAERARVLGQHRGQQIGVEIVRFARPSGSCAVAQVLRAAIVLIEVQPAMHGTAVYPGEVRRCVNRAPFRQIQDDLQASKEFHVLGLRESSRQTTPILHGKDKAASLLRLGHTDIVAAC